MTDKTDLYSTVRSVKIDDKNATQRIDNFLISQLKGVPKSRIYRMIRKGEVRVNRGRAKAQYRLALGDIVRIPPVRTSQSSAPTVSVGLLNSRLGRRIIYEDADLLVINKPFGVAVHGGTGLSFGLIEGLRELRENDHFLELAHRLDRDTSGCLIIARRRSVLKHLHEAFRADRIRKCYSALLSGVLKTQKVIVDQPLKKITKSNGEWMVKISHEGKASRTVFVRDRKYLDSTLVKVMPKTGRTHQIRVHAASLGLPICGDERYGSDDFNRRLRKLGLKRLFLHARSLEFEHPRTGENLRVEAPMGEELSKFLLQLENNQIRN